jgi:hypothetical protein
MLVMAQADMGQRGRNSIIVISLGTNKPEGMGGPAFYMVYGCSVFPSCVVFICVVNAGSLAHIHVLVS